MRVSGGFSALQLQLWFFGETMRSTAREWELGDLGFYSSFLGLVKNFLLKLFFHGKLGFQLNEKCLLAEEKFDFFIQKQNTGKLKYCGQNLNYFNLDNPWEWLMGTVVHFPHIPNLL